MFLLLSLLACTESTPAPSMPVLEQPDGSAKVAVLIKTCRAFHQNRLRSLLRTWGSRVDMRIFVSDSQIVSKSVGANETLIMGDFDTAPAQTDIAGTTFPTWDGARVRVSEAAGLRRGAYVPPWRGVDQHPSRTDSSVPQGEGGTPPALSRRVVHGLEALFDAFHEHADWYLIVDDDTFLRWAPLRAYLSTLDATVPTMVGTPVDSSPFLTHGARPSRIVESETEQIPKLRRRCQCVCV